MEYVFLDNVREIVAAKNVPVEIYSTVRTEQPPQGHLANEIFADWAFFGAVKLVHIKHDISQGANLTHYKRKKTRISL